MEKLASINVLKGSSSVGICERVETSNIGDNICDGKRRNDALLISDRPSHPAKFCTVPKNEQINN
jgi:hypothetical protein